MREVVFQSGNIGLEWRGGAVEDVLKLMSSCCRRDFILKTYPDSSDALQLSLRQVADGDRGRSRTTEQHFIMRGIFCFGRLSVEIRKNHREKTWVDIMKLCWRAKGWILSSSCLVTDLRVGVHPVYPLAGCSHLRVPTDHHPDHHALPLHHHLPNTQKDKRRTRAAHSFGGCGRETLLTLQFVDYCLTLKKHVSTAASKYCFLKRSKYMYL